MAKKQLQTSLERLGTDYLDYYLLHTLMNSNYQKYERFHLWDFLQEQKEKEDYIEKKIRQLDARRERQKQRKAQKADAKAQQEQMELQAEQERIEAFRSAPLKAGEKVRVKTNGMVGEVVKVSAKAVVVTIGNISSKMPLDKVERITSNEFKNAVKEVARPVSSVRVDSSLTERKLNFSTELDVRGERLNDAIEKAKIVNDSLY